MIDLRKLAAEIDPLWPETITGEQITRVSVALNQAADELEAARRLAEALLDLDRQMTSYSGQFMIRSTATPAKYWEAVAEALAAYRRVTEGKA